MATKNKPKRSGTKSRRDDPVVTEIVRNGVIAVTEEMKTNLMRTAYNMIIYEALDFTTGLFTPQGETISIGIGLPMFIRGMAETVKAKIRHFGTAEIRPGDIYVTNDSYLTGSHLNHVTLTLPIFHRGKLVAFSCCMAHWLDIGGILGGKRQEGHPKQGEQVKEECSLRDLVHPSESAVMAHPHRTHQEERRSMDDQRGRDVSQRSQAVTGRHLQVQNQQRQHNREHAVTE